MSNTRLQRVYAESKQSIWLDNLSRPLISSGELTSLIGQGVRGITSNPSIFEKALADSDAYKEQLNECRKKGLSAEETYWELIKKDIVDAAKILTPLYDSSHRKDGYVSVEVDPRLAHDTDATIDQAIKLNKAIKQPNIMIKVPATEAGLPAITALIAQGINVNVTLIFSLEVYKHVIDAYMDGLENHEGDLDSIASVASFFVSRVDGVIDEQLTEDSEYRGKIAIAQARRAYRLFQDSLESPRWKRLAARKATPQRPLWASTSTKNPDYRDTLYVDELIAPDTVNTLPQATLEAYLDHGKTAVSITDSTMASAGQALASLSSKGIDIQAITEELKEKGVAQFVDSFNGPLKTLQQ